MAVKSFKVQVPGADLMRLFWRKFAHTFLYANNIVDIIKNSPPYKKIASQFTEKSFMTSTPGRYCVRPCQAF